MKTTGNKNKQAVHHANQGELVQDIGLEFQFLMEEHPEVLFEGVPEKKMGVLTKELQDERLQVHEDESVYGYAVWVALKHGLPVHSAVAAALYKSGCKLMAGLADGGKVTELERMLKAAPVHHRPLIKKQGQRSGIYKTEKALLRPEWVGVSKAARLLGLQRSTILKWHAAGRVVLPVDGHTRAYRLHRGVLGQVNLTLLQHIAQHKRSLPGPGRRLGNAPGSELVAAAARAHGSPAQAAEYGRVCKALSLLEGVTQVSLLHAARRHLNRLIIRRCRA